MEVNEPWQHILTVQVNGHIARFLALTYPDLFNFPILNEYGFAILWLHVLGSVQNDGVSDRVPSHSVSSSSFLFIVPVSPCSVKCFRIKRERHTRISPGTSSEFQSSW